MLQIRKLSVANVSNHRDVEKHQQHKKHSLRIRTDSLRVVPERSFCVLFHDGCGVMMQHRDCFCDGSCVVVDTDKKTDEIEAVLVSHVDDEKVSKLFVESDVGEIAFERDLENPCVFRKAVCFEPDPERIAQGLEAYDSYKRRVYEDAGCVLAGVGAVVGASGHLHEALAYGLGGALGLVYFGQLILQVDNIEKRVLERIVSAMRLASLSASVAYMDWRYADMLKEEPALLVWGLLGFFSFRIAAVLNKV